MPARHLLPASLALVAALAAGCATEESTRSAGARTLATDSLPSPAGPGSAEPNLAVDEHGRVIMSWLERQADSSHALRFAVLDGRSWGPARTIVERVPFFVNWADFPSIVALPGGRLAAHWLQRSGPGKYAYDVRIAQSSDSGATWSESIVPHRDGLEAEHGFASLFAAPGDSLAAVWLDGRKSEMADSTREMMLATTTIARTGALGAERMLDRRICDCCQTAMALASAGPVVVYRDRSPEEIRDISIVRLVNGAWSEPRTVHDDQWKISACPVNGPAISARGDIVAVAWFTAARDTARVKIAFSRDGGATFDDPVLVDDGTPAGRVDVELLGDGRAAVTWLERVGDGAAVKLREVSADGTRGAATTIAQSSAARASGFPRMALTDGALIFAWTQPGEPSMVRVARATVGSVP